MSITNATTRSTEGINASTDSTDSTDVEGVRQRIQDAGEALCASHLADDTAARFPLEKWQLLADAGLFAGTPDGGSRLVDARFAQTLTLFEELGYRCRDAGLNFATATHTASTLLPVARYGSDSLREQFLPALRSGRAIGAHAISERDAGSDALAMRTTARRADERWILTGDKAYVSNGSIADHIVVYAATGEPGAPDRLSAFLVPTTADGVHVRDRAETMGLRTTPLAEVSFTEVAVPDEHLLSRPGSGFFVLSYVMAREILAVAAINVGEMRRRVEDCTKRARSRHQFGRPIGAFQAVAHSIADMKVQAETARLWLDRTAGRMSRGEDTSLEVAATKTVVSEANLHTARAAVQIFGGEGYLTAGGIERGVRDALAGTIYSGTSEIQRTRIATLLGLPVNN